MVDPAQAGVTVEPKILKTISAHNGMELGLQAHASRSGTIRIGDVFTLRRATQP